MVKQEKRFIGNSEALHSLAISANKGNEKNCKRILKGIIVNGSRAKLEILQAKKDFIDFVFQDSNGHCDLFQLVFLGKVFVTISDAAYVSDMASAIASL